MSDPNRPRQDPPPEGEGLVEKLEQQVEHAVEKVEDTVEKVETVVDEAVEHVPEPIRAPVRWTLHKLILVIGASLVGLVAVLVVGGGYFLWSHTHWAARELTDRVNRTLTTRSDVILSVKDLRGNPLGTVEVVSPEVRFRDGPVLLTARSMRLRYSTWNLFTAPRRALMVEIDRPIVHLQRAPDGRPRYPTWKAGPPSPGRAGGYDFAVKIRDASIDLAGSKERIESLNLLATAATGVATRLDVQSLSWKEGPYGMRLDRFAGSVAVADSVTIEVRELDSPDLKLRGRAFWSRQEGERHAEAQVDRVRWRWLARMFRNPSLDVPGEGRLRFEATGKQDWRGRFESRATWDDLATEAHGAFRWEKRRLSIAPLSGRSDAGNLEGALVWSSQGWEVSGRATAADPSRWSAIGVEGWPAGRLSGRFRYRVDSRDRNHGRLSAWLSESEWAGWRADSGTVAVDFPPGAADSFVVHAFRRGGSITLGAAAHGGAWGGNYTLARFPLDEWPDGRASGLKGTLESGSGTVRGEAGALAVTGTLSGVSTTWFGVRTARWKLERVTGRLLPVPDLTADARLGDVLFLGVHFDSTTTPFHLGDRSLDLPSVKAWAGDTVVTVAGRSTWSERGWTFAADSAAATSSQFRWIAAPPLALDGDRTGVTFERVVATDDTARLEISGRWASPGGTYAWKGRATGLDVGRLGLPHPWGLAGRADAELRVDGPSGDPRWSFVGTVVGPGWQGHRGDSLDISLAGARSRLDVGELAFRLQGGTLHARGQVDGMAKPWPDSLTGESVVRWLKDASRWHGAVDAVEVPVDRLGRVVPGAEAWKGRVTGHVDVDGSPSRPVLDLHATGQPLAWRNYAVDEAHAEARYADERLQVREAHVRRGQASTAVTGEMPLRLSLGRPVELPQAPMSWRLDSPDGDLGLLALFVPQIGSASGRFDVNAVVGGTTQHPALNGTARVRNGRLRLAGREEVLENVSARLTLGESRITLDSLVAVQRTRQGEPGRVSAHGAVELKGGGPVVYGFDGDFKITNGPKVAGHTIPFVTSDNVELRRAVILYDFARQTEAQQVAASTQPLFWTYRLQIHATDNLHWQPPDGDIEFSADLSVEQMPEQLLLYGDIQSLRGTYYFLSNRFAVQSATLTFDNVGGVDPLVEAQATTRLTSSAGSSSGVSGEPVAHDITVRIQGRSSRPAVALSSEPSDLDEAQILKELTVGRFDPHQTSVNPADSYLTRALNRQLSSELSKAFRGYLTEWEIARQSGGVLGQGGVIVGVGSQLNPRLAVRYRQLLPGTGATAAATIGAGTEASLVERDIEAEYRLNRYFYVTTQLTQKRPVAGAASTTPGNQDFNVNLKARWEY